MAIRFLRVLTLAAAMAMATAMASAGDGTASSDLEKQIHEAKLDGRECYRVRDLYFAKEDLKFYLNNGYLIFSEPIAGRPFAAMFSAEVEGGDAEVLVTPPQRAERRSLAHFAGEPTLDAHFKAGVFLFTDKTGAELFELVKKKGLPSREMGLLLADRLAQTLRTMSQGFEFRLMTDLLNGSTAKGLFYAAIASNDHGAVDLVVDPTAHDQVTVGQYATGANNSRAVFDVWSSFPALNARTRPEAAPETGFALFDLSNFKIEAALEADLNLKVRTRVELRPRGAGLKALPFEISLEMEIDEARIDGKVVEILRREAAREAAFRPGDNTLFLLMSEEALDPGKVHEVEIRSHGRVIRSNDSKVFFVGARTNWYPNLGNVFANYEIEFRHPKALDLEMNGELVSSVVEGDTRITKRKTAAPVRFLGFNLGEYQCVERNRTGGFKTTVCASRTLDPALRPRLSKEIPAVPAQPRGVRYSSNLPPIPPAVPDPLGKLNKLANSVEDAFDFMSQRFGPLPYKSLTVTPIPGSFGQGFPGLIYLATAAYVEPEELPPAIRDSGLATFYNDILAAHEMAHQWWGNLVVAASYKDGWLQESLANYSALLYLEKRRGPKPVAALLEQYRNHLLTKEPGSGETVESQGPVTFGLRLVTSRTPEAWHIITYEKGTWILHMLRNELGDAQFQKLLAEIPRRFVRKPLSTEAFQALAAQYLPPKSRDPKLDTFFEHWVYGTGIPALKLNAAVRGARLTGTLAQSGVAQDFEVDVPVEVQFAKGATQTVWLRSNSLDPVEFSIPIAAGATRASIAAAFLQAK